MKKDLRKIIIAAIIFALAVILDVGVEEINIALYLISYVIVGGEIVWKAVKNIIRGKVFDENFLMAIATIGAIIIGEYAEGIAVMLFYQIGELFQSYAVNKSRKSIADLMDIRPDYANVMRGEELVIVDPDEVKVGDVIIIKAGERVPLDGKVMEGNTMVDTSALTGESVPREIGVGDDILSGCININGLIKAEVINEYDESTVSKILDLVENASSKKSHSEQFITRFARYYTPVVVGLALILALLPPLVIEGAVFQDWIYRALSFLVVSCPCALVISVPLTFFSGIGGAAKKGILVKGGNYLEALAKVDTIVFDKTGTLTKGVFNVQEIQSQGITRDELLRLTAHAESYSNHPISISLQRAYGEEIDSRFVTEAEEISGHGISSLVQGKRVLAGNYKLMELYNIPYKKEDIIGTLVHVAVDNQYAGYILIADEVKEDSTQAIADLKESHISKTVMLTGDNQRIGEKVAAQLGLDQVYTDLLPIDKVERLEELLADCKGNGTLAFVGDGMNDAPVLAMADIGIAMGGFGADAAIEAADIVIMNDEPSKITSAINIAKKVLRIANQNIAFAIGVKIVILILSAMGITTMWAAIFGDVGVTILAIINSFRALNVRKL